MANNSRVIGLLHNEVFMPNGVKEKVKELESKLSDVKFSWHLEQQCIDNDDYKHFLDKNRIRDIILNLKNNYVEPFEVEVSELIKVKNSKHITKFVIRTTYDKDRDISIVIIPKYNKENNTLTAFIKTAWLNSKLDKHFTLDDSKYLKTLK